MTHYTKDQYAAALERVKDNPENAWYCGDKIISALRILAGQDDRFVVVPREITESMQDAFVKECEANATTWVITIKGMYEGYKAMLAASEDTE